MTNAINLKSKFLGAMVGSALGDAIGELAFQQRDEASLRAEIERLNVLVYTDDTAMAIGLAESIVCNGCIEEQHLGDTFKAHFRHEPWRGYAAGPPTIFSLVERHGLTYQEAARSLFGGLGSFGNGAAMRITPVGLFFYDAADIYEAARASAMVTHAHPVGVDGAAVLAWAIAYVLQLHPSEPFPAERFCRALVERSRTPEMQNKLAKVQTLIAQNAPPREAARQLGQGVAVQDSMPFALYSFLRHSNSFENCLFCAVLNGGDRDTLGAMACAVSGAYLGTEAIPPRWREKLENHDYIERLATELLARKQEGQLNAGHF